jgi:hypothetical protein
MLVEGFTPVLWITLTEKNGTCPIQGMEHVSKFLIELSFVTKSHLLIFRAGDYGHNFHEHVIPMIPNAELERFSNRLPKFKAWKHWTRRHLYIKKWDSSYGSGAFVYQDNHINWRQGGKILPAFKPYILCPKCFRKCKANHCCHNSLRLGGSPT